EDRCQDCSKRPLSLGETWHPEHFVCSVCKMELCTTGFFEREGRPYCAKDYHDEFAPQGREGETQHPYCIQEMKRGCWSHPCMTL
uniref:LIM zinc-binding domain-containing protein n=1 Tax=Periophthalmus magnuspinnatus TaxID=409849 RepID=A0A3B4AR41_9GOBI